VGDVVAAFGRREQQESSGNASEAPTQTKMRVQRIRPKGRDRARTRHGSRETRQRGSGESVKIAINTSTLGI